MLWSVESTAYPVYEIMKLCHYGTMKLEADNSIISECHNAIISECHNDRQDRRQRTKDKGSG